MKNLKLICSFILVVSSLLFFQCTSEYIAIPGANGVDGIDGHDGLDGADASAAVCIACHSNTHRDPIRDAYAFSGHGSGNSWARGVNNSTCARCHNNQGLIDILSGHFIDDNGFPTTNSTEGAYPIEEPITCTGCHDTHRSFDFENDGNDYAVRTLAPISLLIDPSVIIDIKNSADALGKSNLCVNCHQPRNSYTIPAGIDDYAITSSRFGPHHGPQSTLFEGIMGANIPGAVGYPGVASSGHRSEAACITCHMGTPTVVGFDGGHTWKPTLNTCITCHTSMTAIPNEITGFTDDYNMLEALLIEKGALNPDGSIKGSSSNPNVLPSKVAQALWNWVMLEEDKSNGIHNPPYTKALLKNSIEALQN